MKDKEKQILEMARDLDDCVSYDEWSAREYGEYTVDCSYTAYKLFDKGYRKINENEVVISKEEYEVLINQNKGLKEENHILRLENNDLEAQVELKSKETVEKILNEIGNHLKKYSHIHKYAEQARKSKEEYADGTPVELNSVWEVLTLHKNGYDTYETMCELQDNIGYIQESRLLQEFEKDFMIYAKQFGVEIKE